MPIGCVILDDHLVVRTALRMMLDSQDDIEVVGTCDTREALLGHVRDSKPDMLLLDLDVPGCDAFQAGDDARRMHESIRLVALTAYPTDANITRAISGHFDGFLVKTEPASFVIDSIRKIHGGERVYSKLVQDRLKDAGADRITEPKLSALSRSELGVVTLAAQGLSMKDIGERLSRSPRTIEKHLMSAMRKTGASSRVELVRWAIREGLVQA